MVVGLMTTTRPVRETSSDNVTVPVRPRLCSLMVDLPVDPDRNVTLGGFAEIVRPGVTLRVIVIKCVMLPAEPFTVIE